MHHMYKHASYLTVSLQCSRKYKNEQIFNFKIPYEIIFSIINKIKSNSDGSKTIRTTRVEHAFGMDPPAFVSRWNLNLSGHLATQIRQCKGRAVITYLNKRDQYNIIAPHTQFHTQNIRLEYPGNRSSEVFHFVFYKLLSIFKMSTNSSKKKLVAVITGGNS